MSYENSIDSIVVIHAHGKSCFSWREWSLPEIQFTGIVIGIGTEKYILTRRKDLIMYQRISVYFNRTTPSSNVLKNKARIIFQSTEYDLALLSCAYLETNNVKPCRLASGRLPKLDQVYRQIHAELTPDMANDYRYTYHTTFVTFQHLTLTQNGYRPDVMCYDMTPIAIDAKTSCVIDANFKLMAFMPYGGYCLPIRLIHRMLYHFQHRCQTLCYDMIPDIVVIDDVKVENGMVYDKYWQQNLPVDLYLDLMVSPQKEVLVRTTVNDTIKLVGHRRHLTAQPIFGASHSVPHVIVNQIVIAELTHDLCAQAANMNFAIGNYAVQMDITNVQPLCCATWFIVLDCLDANIAKKFDLPQLTNGMYNDFCVYNCPIILSLNGESIHNLQQISKYQRKHTTFRTVTALSPVPDVKVWSVDGNFV